MVLSVSQWNRHQAESNLFAAAIHCSSLRPSGQQCVLKYCKACMRNRYQTEIEDLKAQGSTGITDDARKTHATQVPYVYRHVS